MKAIGIAILAAGISLFPAYGQTTADLLQKGIYTQETVGDLDGAIKIFRQVTASASESRAYAAQAQFRIGLCLLKKGASADAVAAFKRVVSDYPEQSELVAKAKAYLPSSIELLPAPWTDGEVLEYDLTAQTGIKSGKLIQTMTIAGANTTFDSRMHMMGMGPFVTRVEFESNSMAPVRELLQMRPMMEATMEFSGGQARFTQSGKEPKTIALDGLVFTNEEITQLLRRLPLKEGYRQTVPIFSSVGMTMKLELSVTGVEDLTVAAGKFHCYKVEVLGQNMWVAAEGTRPVVKLVAMGVGIELASVQNRRDLAPSTFRDDKQRFSLRLPAGWTTLTFGGETKQVMLADPAGEAMVVAVLIDKKTNPQIAKDLQDTLDETVKSKQAYFKDYALRPASTRSLQVSGNLAISAVGEYTEGSNKAIDYLVFVRSAESRVHFMIKTTPEYIDSVIKRLDPIIQTLTMP